MPLKSDFWLRKCMHVKKKKQGSVIFVMNTILFCLKHCMFVWSVVGNMKLKLWSMLVSECHLPCNAVCHVESLFTSTGCTDLLENSHLCCEANNSLIFAWRLIGCAIARLIYHNKPGEHGYNFANFSVTSRTEAASEWLCGCGEQRWAWHQLQLHKVGLAAAVVRVASAVQSVIATATATAAAMKSAVAVVTLSKFQAMVMVLLAFFLSWTVPPLHDTRCCFCFPIYFAPTYSTIFQGIPLEPR